VIDILLFSLFIVYYVYRMGFPFTILPSEYVIDKDNKKVVDHKKMELYDVKPDFLAFMSIMNFILYLAIGFKCMSFMRFISNLG